MKQPITLDDKYRIDYDKYSFVLVFSEMREKEELDKDRKKTGRLVPYLYEEPSYHPTIGQCLKRYLNEAVRPLETVQEMYDKILEIEDKVNEAIAIFKPDGRD